VTLARAVRVGLVLTLALLATAHLLSHQESLLLSSIFAAMAMALAAVVTSRELADRRRDRQELGASERALQQEAERLAAVIAAQQLVATTSTDVSGIMRVITQQVQALTRASGAVIGLREEYQLVIRAGSGNLTGEIGLGMPLTSGLAGQCWRSGEILRCDDAESDARVNREMSRRLQVRSLVAVPLWDAGVVTGVMVTAATEPFAFTDRDVQTVQLVAGLLANGLSRAAALEARESALAALQESEQRYRSAVAALQEGIALVHADGRVQPVNASAERMLAPLSVDGAALNLFERPWSVLREDGTPWTADDLPCAATLCTGRSSSGSIIGLPDGGRGTTWLSVNCEPLWRDHEPLPHAAVASFTDITERLAGKRTADLARLNEVLEAELGERRRTEEELRRAHDELELRVDERTGDLIFVNQRLVETRDAAELANLAKSQFLANMSHELRTPLNSVIGFANILLKNRQQTLSAQDVIYLTRIQENGRHLLGLINDILDLSKIEAGRVDLSCEPVDLAALVDETLGQLGAHLLRPTVRLVREVPDGLRPIEADATRLKQVLMNLVANAIKFTDRGSVTVRVTAEPVTARPLEIAVHDTGIGMPADRLEAVFEAFQQGDNTTERRYGGTGLGLAISRSLLQVMGYRLTVESEVGVGSIFTIHLDDAATEEASVSPGPSLGTEWDPAFAGRRVLVIDDESDSRIVLREYLKDLGCEVRVAGWGAEGLAAAREWRPNLITLDLRLPGMDGSEILRRLKEDPDLARIPVVVISIVGEDHRGRLPGAAEVIDKPVTREMLREALGPHLRAA
jgi:signal transduction histidine kinase/GAF domain-containing protein